MKQADLATFLGSSADDRRDAFEGTASDLGVSPEFVEKDFWVCWTLDALFSLPNPPHLLFKGGTSLSKAWGGLIQRFSEDIDVVVSREDLGQPGTPEEISTLSRKQRERRLDDIKDACSAHVLGPLRSSLEAKLVEVNAFLQGSTIRIEAATPEQDPDGQTLNVVYPTLFATHDYVDAWVKIEAGAKSDFYPHETVEVVPYVSSVVEGLDLAASSVVAVRPERTFWDKVIILHGQRAYFGDTGKVLRDGNKLSRHYYDLHRLCESDVLEAALADSDLMSKCVEHCKAFFNRRNFALDQAAPGSFRIVPPQGMEEIMAADYGRMQRMLFGERPVWKAIMGSLADLEARLNIEPSPASRI